MSSPGERKNKKMCKQYHYDYSTSHNMYDYIFSELKIRVGKFR